MMLGVRSNLNFFNHRVSLAVAGEGKYIKIWKLQASGMSGSRSVHVQASPVVSRLRVERVLDVASSALRRCKVGAGLSYANF